MILTTARSLVAPVISYGLSRIFVKPEKRLATAAFVGIYTVVDLIAYDYFSKQANARIISWNSPLYKKHILVNLANSTYRLGSTATFSALYLLAKYINLAIPSYIESFGLICFCESNSQAIENLLSFLACGLGWDRLLD